MVVVRSIGREECFWPGIDITAVMANCVPAAMNYAREPMIYLGWTEAKNYWLFTKMHAGAVGSEKSYSPALIVRSGMLHAGVICKLVPRQMARSALLASCSDLVSSSAGSASSLSRYIN